jgi:hypothetical protein
MWTKTSMLLLLTDFLLRKFVLIRIFLILQLYEMKFEAIRSENDINFVKLFDRKCKDYVQKVD